MRSSPQVIGAAHDALAWAQSQVEIELNGVGDNPIFLPEERLTLTGANFQGTPVSLPMEIVGQAVTMVCVLSERRLNRLENPALSQGLPAFLTPNPGFYSGLMLSQYAADTLIVEQRILAAPASTMSHPGGRRPGGLRLHGHEHGPQERPDPRQRLRRAGHRVHGRGAGPRLPRVHARARACRPRARSSARHVDAPRRRPAAVPGPQRDGRLVRSGEILEAVEAVVGPLG